MSKRTLSVTVEDSQYEELDDLADDGAEANKSEVARDVIDYGLRRYRLAENCPPGTRHLRKMMEISAVATMLTFAVALGLSSADVWHLTAGFAGVTTVFAASWGSFRYKARS